MHEVGWRALRLDVLGDGGVMHSQNLSGSVQFCVCALVTISSCCFPSCAAVASPAGVGWWVSCPQLVGTRVNRLCGILFVSFFVHNIVLPITNSQRNPSIRCGGQNTFKAPTSEHS